jgi:hypothetical protein
MGRQGIHGEYDIALVFSQDQDHSEVADEIRAIAAEQTRWIKMACAFPSSPTSRNRRSVNKTDWVRIARDTYDACLDGLAYRTESV